LPTLLPPLGLVGVGVNKGVRQMGHKGVPPFSIKRCKQPKSGKAGAV